MLKNEKGITLIALIITIIVMLILVGVTINVVLNGGLFEKAEEATRLTQIEAEKEELLSAVVAAIGTDGKVVLGDIQLPPGWTGSNGTYTSPKGNTYIVDENGKITVDQSGETPGEDDDLAYVKAELEGKMFGDVISGFDSNGNPIFKNTEVKFIANVEDFNGDRIAAIGMYKGKYYQAICDDFTLQNPKIIKVEKNTYGVYTDNYFRIGIEGTKAKIFGLTQKGKENIAQNKKLIIPATISCVNGINYTVTEIGQYAFRNNTDLSGNVIIPNSVTTIRQHAFEGCTSIESLTIPSSVDTLSWNVFKGWTDAQTIYMQGRTEAPVTIDDYQGQGWQHNWQYGSNANIVWEQ